MGNRANVVKKYVCEFAQDTENFNWLAEEVLNMLNGYEVNVTTSDEDNAYCNWEIDPTTFEECLTTLKRLPPDEINEFFSDEKEENNRFTNGELVKIFRTWRKYVDPQYNVIRVHWF